jgi:putative addiction module killer protein
MAMIEVRQTDEFRTWLRRLKDGNALARIVARIRRMEQGNPGDTNSVGKALWKCGSTTVRATACTTCITVR